jgi:hypothetical protein
MTLKKKNFFILILVIFEILYFKEFLFRPYNTPGQESLISFFAHQAAMSNWVRLDHNIFVTKILECDGSLVFFNEVSNWPNGFFYLFSFIIKFFGNLEIVGRSFAIFLNLSGMYLFVKYSCKQNEEYFLLFSIPIVLASPIGLSSINVVYPDSMLILLISLLNISISNFIFYSLCIFLTPLFYHIVFFYNFTHLIYLHFRKLISINQFIYLSIFLIFTLFYLIYVLSVNENGFEFKKLIDKFLVRSFYPNLVEFESSQHEVGENVNFYHRTYMFYSLIKDNLSIFIFPFLFLGLKNELQNRTLLSFFYISTVIINYIFLQYFIVHYYSNLIFVFLSIILSLIGLNVFLKYFELQKYNLLVFTLILLSNITIINKDLIYQKWDPVIEDSNSFRNFLSTSLDKKANKFALQNYSSDKRICGFYLLPTIIENYNQKDKIQYIDLNLY